MFWLSEVPRKNVALLRGRWSFLPPNVNVDGVSGPASGEQTRETRSVRQASRKSVAKRREMVCCQSRGRARRGPSSQVSDGSATGAAITMQFFPADFA